ncbi:MAG: hypothetical protein H6813_01640 [Phycisphaeraceae bacterium]|nr:hypothetical protein [Phycisphaeraceae bacterium]
MSGRDGFYVGYLPTPRRHLLFLWIAAPLVAGALGALAGFFSASQRDPGAGVWDTGSPIAVEGTLLVEPYPILIDDHGATHLLVEIGKHGAQERAEGIGAGRARALGYPLEREGRRMLELVEGGEGLERAAGADHPVRIEPAGEQVTLRGEILDSKCYLGAMKPGDGKGHKACATLCVTGGIPPLLRVWTEGGAPRHLLLLDSRGASARQLVLDWIGEPVSVTGGAGRVGDLETLSIDAGAIERLGR